MNLEQLKAAGKLLYGREWQSNLARDLNIDPRRVREWVAKERSLPRFLDVEVAKLLEKNQHNIDAFLADFEAQQASMINAKYVLVVSQLSSRLALKDDEDAQLSKVKIVCLTSERLVTAYLRSPEAQPDHICYIKDGTWYADLLTSHNRQDDQTIYYGAIVEDGERYKYDFDLHDKLSTK